MLRLRSFTETRFEQPGKLCRAFGGSPLKQTIDNWLERSPTNDLNLACELSSLPGRMQANVDFNVHMLCFGHGMKAMRRVLRINMRGEFYAERNDTDFFHDRHLGSRVIHPAQLLDPGDAGAQRFEISNESPDHFGRSWNRKNSLALMHHSHHLLSLKSAAMIPAAL